MLVRRSTPFTDVRYLDALEASGCASRANGWTPAHVVSADGRVPCYEKAHSWGEFVFDFELARYWQRRGWSYYPKLVSCVPFTPVPGARLLADAESDRRRLARQLRERAQAGYSGAHVLFVDDADRALLAADGWIERAQPRFVWRARNESDFEAFLARLSSKRRKNIRAERRKLIEFAIRWQRGDSFDAHEWARLYTLYSSTYAMRGQSPYLNLDCLQRWARDFGPQMQFCVAYHRGELVAMAFFFEDEDTLYGRHWGSAASYDSLHFELCYYQGIERCLQRGLRCFDAGVQGEHKLARGFEAELAWSAHWFSEASMRAPIAEAFAHEASVLRRTLADQ